MEKLPGDYIAGFVDGEGCFALKFRRDIRHNRKNKPIYFYWDIEFAIVLRQDDKELLEKIQTTLGCGKINISQKANSARYSVNDLSDLINIIVPFFDVHKLHGKKYYDFELWKNALKLLYKNKGLKTNIYTTGNLRGTRKVSWVPKDLEYLKEIHQKMKRYKSNVAEWKWL